MKFGMKARLIVLITPFVMAACSSMPENIVGSPDVSLRNVQIVGVGIQRQTFLLSFDVANPNPFPLPVQNVGYGIKLDGLRFASGETISDFTVPAAGDATFAISVDLNLLKTAPQLLSIMREGVRDEIPYELEGRLSVDIPFAPPVKYHTDGMIQLQSKAF